ncbi:MAG: ABC transporter ATP-binding protein [Chloroflexi bacterium]|nr:ABC transporter ATP-binding protein [Chloroflexota bacterium]
MAQRRKNRKAKEFWALHDVSFQVQKGETLGIIGSNGSGKSTSLKLISRIISPTSGTVRVNGRVTALLELGAGFHPELSGRDNIYLNGTVMGLSRKEIDYKVDSIIEFAELQEFIDVPVKNYSSGMYARLGFSVSVHLDPDILLIDEVLSVGDQSFQQKCNERMLNLRKKGVTILLVSHDIDAVWRLCSRAVWLDHGALKLEGAASKVTDSYFKYVLEQSAKNEQTEAWSENRLGSGEAYITDVEFLGEEMLPRHIFLTNEALIVRLHYETRERVERPMFGLAFHQASSGIHLAGPNSRFGDCDIPAIDGRGYIDYHVKQLPLLPGDYLIDASIYDWQDTHRYDYWHQCARFTVVPGGTKERYGVMSFEGKWRHSPLDSVSSDQTLAAENKSL